MKNTFYADCGRCGLSITDVKDSIALYTHPDPTSTAFLSVHAECVADEHAEGTIRHVGGQFYRVVEQDVPEPRESFHFETMD